MRRPLIAGNMKMYKTTAEAKTYSEGLKKATADVKHCDILVCPTFTSLHAVGPVLKSSSIKYGAQNMYFEDQGAFTGEISADMLLDLGCTHVILGHSERRHKFGEGSGLINKKVRKAIEKNLVPILCVGETLEERESKITEKIVEDQVRKGFEGVSNQNATKVIIAYEPVWAIGTGKTATPEDAESVHAFIRKLLNELYDNTIAESIIILYGGSVKPENIAKLMAMKNIDGALVGGACLEVESFEKIIRFNH